MLEFLSSSFARFGKGPWLRDRWAAHGSHSNFIAALTMRHSVRCFSVIPRESNLCYKSRIRDGHFMIQFWSAFSSAHGCDGQKGRKVIMELDHRGYQG